MTITTLGIDLAKSVFHLHGVDADGAVVLRKKLRRGAVLDVLGKLGPCLIRMEACATSHYWAREISALGHDCQWASNRDPISASNIDPPELSWPGAA
jgi:transposase